MDAADCERLIDYIRVHVSQAGGLTPCRKIAAIGEASACGRHGTVRAMSRRSVMPRNVALVLVSYNFGVQEYSALQRTARGNFLGLPGMKNGYLYANENPGWGIEVEREGGGEVSTGALSRRAASAAC